jgi:3-hydroxymyristoyl/3-hydroxydecanoyl-(acyl carrier protein) dehydratase
MRVVAEPFCIAADHPSLPGHFPGRPVVPGVVLLDHALSLIGAGDAASLERVRFLRPVPPGRALTVTAEPAGSAIAFACADADGPVLTGRVRVRPPP